MGREREINLISRILRRKKTCEKFEIFRDQQTEIEQLKGLRDLLREDSQEKLAGREFSNKNLKYGLKSYQ